MRRTMSTLLRGLDVDEQRLMYLVNEGIRRNGRLNPDPQPRRVYYPFFP